MATSRHGFSPALLVLIALAVGGCTISEGEPPPLTGPSELGKSVTIFANPDVLSQDGRSQSVVVVEVRDANGRPQRDVPLRAEITAGGVFADVGSLSSRNVVTSSDGRAQFTYTAPPPPAVPIDPGAFVTILVTPTSTDFRADLARQVDIRLVPPGVILPPEDLPTARFTISPSPTEGTAVRFDGTGSSAGAAAIVAWDWNFGDGATGSGPQVTHTYAAGATYTVTLTVTDERGLRGSFSQQVTVGTTANPVASFTVSPTNPTPVDTVFFNASASTAATGRRIVSYLWTFGDGRTGTGVTTSNRYGTTGNFNVVLTVTDDIGRTGTTSQSITVGTAQRPTAAFTFSPTQPVVGQQVNFDGSISTAPAGRTLVSFEWSLGDTTVKTGPRITHVYQAAGTGSVTLTVTDSAGERASSTQTITIAPVSSQNPTASFTVSPSPAVLNQLVVVDATASTAPQGATIVRYEWNFGDSVNIDPVTTPVHSHRYQPPTLAGTYTITLTVVDSQGRRGTTTQTLVVDP